METIKVYETKGAGTLIILIYVHIFDTRQWDDNMESLTKDHQVIRYEMRGYGKSDMPEVGNHFLQVPT